MRTITLILLALVLVAGATTVTFQPDATVGKDAFTTSVAKDSNFGDQHILMLGRADGVFMYTFIEFTELNDPQYQGATVNSAHLKLRVDIIGSGTSSTDQYEIGPCSTAWVEDTITWNNQPSVHESVTLNYTTDFGWVSIDVTSWVQKWLDGTWDNYGFSLFDEDGNYEENHSYSSDFPHVLVFRPRLVMEYSDSAIEEATWGQIKARP